MFIEDLKSVSDEVLLKENKYCDEFLQLFMEGWYDDQSQDWFLYHKKVLAEMERRGLKNEKHQ